MFVITSALYINTLGHKYIFKDEQSIKKNEAVLRGVKSIPEILTHPYQYSFYKESGLEKILPQRRYGPITEISLAIEQEIAGTWNTKVPRQFIWDVNGNGEVDPDEDLVKDYLLNEDDFFERGTGLRHFNNLLLYVLCVIGLFIVAKKYFTFLSPDSILLACLIFAVHPIHSEVVNNISARDELFSMLFFITSLLFLFRFSKFNRNSDLIVFSALFFLALLSKEYALLFPLIYVLIIFLLFPEFKIKWDKSLYFSLILLILGIVTAYFIRSKIFMALIVPLVFFFVFQRFVPKTANSNLIFAITIPLIAYLIMRWNALPDQMNFEFMNSNVINNPYLTAKPNELFPTKLHVILKYFILFFYPSTLSCDYSFSSISFSTFLNWQVWLSLLILISLIVFTVYSVFKRKPISVFFTMILVFILPITNLFFNTYTIMSERFFYHTSIGMCFILVWPINLFLNKYRNDAINFRLAIGAPITLLLILFFYLGFIRNGDWKTNDSIYSTDIAKYPNNLVIINGKAEALYLKAVYTENKLQKENLVKESVALIDRGLKINAAYMSLFQTLALDYYIIGEKQKSVTVCNTGLKIDTANFILKKTKEGISMDYVRDGIELFNKNKKDSALIYFDNAISAWEQNSDAWYNKAYTLKSRGDTAEAIGVLSDAIKLKKTKELLKLIEELNSSNRK